MFYDLGVVFYVRVNNYIYMYVLPPQYVEAKTSHWNGQMPKVNDIIMLGCTIHKRSMLVV